MAAALEESKVKVIAGSASSTPWANCGPGIEIKVLAIDEKHHSVQYLARTSADHNVGVHRNAADTNIYVLEGSIKNLTTGCEFGIGDFCFQPAGDVHEELVGPEGVTTYVSQRGDSDVLVEFMDKSGAVCDNFSLSDFANLL